MKPVVFHDLAVAELDEAAAWYEKRKHGVGVEFRVAVEDAVGRMQSNPQAGSRYGRTRFRFVLVRRFPHVVFYAEGEEAICAHAPPHLQPLGDDPLQPHVLRAAVRIAGSRDGLGLERAEHAAGSVPLARFGGHPGLHGHRPQRGNGLQSPGRPANRRLEPAHQNAAPALRRA